MPKTRKRPAPKSRPSSITTDTHYSSGLRRRHAAAQRLPRLDCGCCSDPWSNRHRSGPRPWGYALAVAHLADHGLLPAPPDGLDELRTLWRAEETRELAAVIAECWGVAA